MCWRLGQPVVTLSTHMDTVPPFFPSREDAEFIWGRGACDAKGIIASMVGAAEKLLAEAQRNFGLLFVVGEERNSAGAVAAARSPRGSRYLVNGEPTENKLALASKGALRFEVIARGRAGAFGLSGTGRIGHRSAARRSGSHSPGAACRRTRCWAQHDEHRHDRGRARAERDRRFGESGNSGAAGGRSGADPRSVLLPPSGSRAESERGSVHSRDAIRSASTALPTTVVSFTTDVPVFGRLGTSRCCSGPAASMWRTRRKSAYPRSELLRGGRDLRGRWCAGCKRSG